MLRNDSCAGVAHSQTNKFACASLGVRLRVSRVDIGEARSDHQLAAARHGIARVDDKIDKHLLHHNRQQIVEVVRDAACKLTDAFHLLRLAQLRFEFFAFRDVLFDGKEIGNLPTLIADGRYDVILRVKAAIFATVNQFAVPNSARE
jgi:hypothetical protein